MTSSALERTSVSTDAQRFLAGARLRDEQVVEIDAELAGVLRIERVLDVDERREAAALLRLRDDREGERRFAGGFRAVNFHDAAARKAADAERAIDQNVAGGDDVDVDDLLVAEAHDRAVAVVLGDLLDGEIEVLVAGGDEFVFGRFFFSFGGHKRLLATSLRAARQAEKRPNAKKQARKAKSRRPRGLRLLSSA